MGDTTVPFEQLLRRYDQAEDDIGARGYPRAWDRCPVCNGTGLTVITRTVRAPGSDEPVEQPGPPITCVTCGSTGSLKGLVRQQAADRCVRCHHPYRVGMHGTGEWTPCTAECAHDGPLRVVDEDRPLGIVEPEGTKDVVVPGLGVDPDELGDLLGKTAGELVDLGFGVEAQWRILTVHHLTGEKTDCRWWNLAPLCQRCHLTIQGKVVMDRAFILEHSEWMKPYAAGFYAEKYEDLPDITRDEAVARLDELLAHERLDAVADDADVRAEP